MDLANLLATLRPLVADPEKSSAEILRHLRAHQDLAEYEVARALVADALLPGVEKAARSVDPRERKRALETVRLTFPRSLAAKIARRLIKDPDSGVAGAARNVASSLGLAHEVALRDTRLPVPRFPAGQGGFNTSGWLFGLRRHGKPKPPPPGRAPIRIADASELAAFVGVADVADLVRLTRPGEGKGAPYVAFDIPKAKGGTRTIHAPRRELRRIQRKILDEILAPLPVHEACHGFVRGRSTVSNARPHLGAAVVVKTDLVDFFPSIHYRRVQGFFEQLGYGAEVATHLSRLVTHRPKLPDGRVVWPGALPQGAPTSPALANLIARRLDQRLAGLARKVGATYTRYADDLTFSFAAKPTVEIGRFLWWIDQICQQEGFSEHSGKRRVLGGATQQRVTGVVVNRTLTVPRVDRRRFRAVLHNCKTKGLESEAKGRKDFPAFLRGYAAYVRMVQPELGARLAAEVEAVLGGQR